GAHLRRGKRAPALCLLERFAKPHFPHRRRIHDRSAGDHQLTPTVIDLEPVALMGPQSARVYVSRYRHSRTGPTTFNYFRPMTGRGAGDRGAEKYASAIGSSAGTTGAVESGVAAAEGTTLATMAPLLATAVPIVGAVAAGVALLAHFIGGGCGNACIDA